MAFSERGGNRGPEMGKEDEGARWERYEQYVAKFHPDALAEYGRVPEPNNAGEPLLFEDWCAEEDRVKGVLARRFGIVG